MEQFGVMLKNPALPASNSLQSSAPESLGRKAAVALSMLLMVALLTGCGLRLETSVPQPLVPDSNELARQTMVNDLVLIQNDITTALASDGFTPEQQAGLHQVQQLNAHYEELLGGVYRSGLPQEDPESPTPLPATTDEQPQIQGTQDVIDRLLASAGRVRTTLPIAQDPDLARLFGSMAISNLLLAQSLAKEADIEFVVPEFLNQPVPENVLESVPEQVVHTLIVNEDAAGYGFEVIAAMRPPERRAVALGQGQLHRETSQFWAQTAQVSETDQDPRRVAYALPFDLTDQDAVAPEDDLVALAQELETTLATNYLDLIAHATPDHRAYFYDSAIRSALIGVDWGVTPGELPFFTGNTEFLSAHAEATE